MAYPEGSSIEWKTYSQQSFNDAKQQLKPVFLLISAQWDHWCRKYREECLESPEISRTLNKHFVPIFVDSDKRSDLAQMLLAGGWPTTVFYDFKGQKLISFKGYINKATLLAVMEKILRGKADPDVELSNPDESRGGEHSRENTAQFLNEYTSQLAFLYDDMYGGFGKGAKYMNTHALDYLLMKYASDGKSLWKGMVERSLKAMLVLEDGAEGGFFRNAAKREWTELQYEKLLVENANAADIYVKASKMLGNDEFARISERTYDWMRTRLYDQKDGGFYGSQQADEHYFLSEMEERRHLSRPYIDRTKHCDMNSQAVVSFLHGHKLLAKLEYWEIAERTLDFMERSMIGGNGALHYFDEQEGAKLDGLLIDNAWAAVAFLEAHRIGKQQDHFETGEKLLEFCISRFFDKEKGVFRTRNSDSVDMYRSNELKSNEVRYYENAVVSWALMLGHSAANKAEYLEIARRVSGNFAYCEREIDREGLMALVCLNLAQIP